MRCVTLLSATTASSSSAVSGDVLLILATRLRFVSKQIFRAIINHVEPIP